MPRGCVIVGTGQAGFQTAASLRTEGYLEPITLIGDEAHLPYQRPPLSKGFLLGKQDLDSIELRPSAFYRDHHITLLTAEKVSAIDRAERNVQLASGGRISYDTLVLATGGRNRLLPVKGAGLNGVVYLRSMNEAILLRDRLKSVEEIVVVGGGFVGLEVAAAASSLGKSVTVLEALPRLMSRAVAPVISEFYQQLHTSHGVHVHCGCAVTGLTGERGKVRHVLLDDGRKFSADLVLVGIGIVPNVELAAQAGLPVTNGIAVNEFLQTADSNIYAIGDCVEHPCNFAGCRLRLESVQNAADQAQCVAAAIAGRPAPYTALPWFWTDQYDIKLQMAGISSGYDAVVTRGTPESRKLSVFYYKNGKLIAIDSINRPLDHMIGRKILTSGMPLESSQAADESVDLRKLEHAYAQANPVGPGHVGSH